jgi:FkbM family methyltransferase
MLPGYKLPPYESLREDMRLVQIFGHYIDANKIKDGMIIVDAGACRGDFLKDMEHLLNDVDYRYYGFECCQANFEFFTKHNQNSKAKFYELALVGQQAEDSVAFTEFTSIDPNHRYFEWSNTCDLYEGTRPSFIKLKHYDVNTVKINDIFSLLGIDHIDHFKMDIEGREYEVIDSMTQETASKIDQISLEIHGNLAIQKFVLQKFQNLGYKYFKFDRETFSPDSSELYVSRT